MAGHGLGAREAEVCEFQFAHFAYEQVLGFDVAVEDAALVAVGQASEELEEEEADVAGFEAAAMALEVLR